MKRALYHTLSLAAAVGLLWTAGTMHGSLLQARRTHGLAHTEPLENAPPLVVFSTVALGGLSGILSDWLWVRAAQLQMDGHYMELVQLADWITRLQPRFAQGWVYHAWNLSYNVSVMFQRPEDRWRWVRHGIELLRDGGLRYNPRNATIHRELGWLFQHKLGASLDQAHLHYKYEWAMEMTRLFDGPAPDYDRWERTPSTREALMRQPGMPELIAQVQGGGIDPFALRRPSGDSWDALVSAVDGEPLGDVLLDYCRIRMLTDQYRLDPSQMRRIEAAVGPLDWRLPQAHAVYWAWSGRPYAEGFDAVMLDRMIFQNMADAFRQGRLVFSADEGLFIPAPNPDLLPYVMRAYEEAVDLHDDDAMRTAHLNFLNHALTVLYTYNRTQDARLVFDVIRERYGHTLPTQDMEEYVVALFVERIEDLSDQEALSFVEGAFYQHFFWLALGDDARAAGYDRLARRTWHLYMAPRMGNLELLERTGLPPVEDIRRMALDQVRDTLTARASQERLP